MVFRIFRRSAVRLDDVIVHQKLHELKPRLIPAFRLDHVIHVMLGQIEDIGRSALNLELLKAHRDVGVPDLIRTDVILQLLDLKQRSAGAGAVIKPQDAGILTLDALHIQRHVMILPHMVCIDDLLLTDCLIMLGSGRTSRIAAGIHQQLAFFLIGDLFQCLEIMVEVVVNDDDMIILADLLTELIAVSDALTG